MILFPILFFAMLLVYWALARQLRTLLWKEWSTDSQNAFVLIREVVGQQLRTLSSQNAVAQALVDYELKFKNLRSSMMMLCFQKLGLLVVGLLLLCSLHWEAVLAALVIATVILAFASKKPSKWIQIFLLGACFFGLFQGSFYTIHQLIFADGGTDLAFALADGRFNQLLILTAASFLLTLVIRFEFWSLFLAALLFFAGAVPLTNAMGLILGEQLAWAVFWFLGARKSSRVSARVFLEYLILVGIAAIAFMSLALTLRGWGLLDISIFGSLVDKKILLLSIWGAWEVSISVLLLIWGHFRARSRLEESSELEPIQFPVRLLGVSWQGYKGWIFEQVQFRKQLMQQKVQRLEGHLKSLTIDERKKFPPGFLDKTQREVESLKRLLGSLPTDSV